MGINGLFEQIRPRDPISLRKLAIETLAKTGRPLRLAVDVSIWQFQAKTARGGENPATRVLFYRLVRLIGIPIQAIFVFDGPEKPQFKRNKRSGLGGAPATAQAKALIRLFGFVVHDAPGEGEAECAMLQQQGIVDAVLSEDVDTLMFGCTKMMRDTSANGHGCKALTQVSVYDSLELRGGASLDRDGMVLVALLSGGDYSPRGVPGFGVKVACEAAVAGYGKSLCRLKPSDREALGPWKRNLLQELRSNAAGFFKTKHKTLDIPKNFPNFTTLQNYTCPVVSSLEALNEMKSNFQETKEVDVAGLREFCQQELRLDRQDWSDKAYSRSRPQSARAFAIHENSTTAEFRVCYIPVNIVALDLEMEQEAAVETDGDSEEMAVTQNSNGRKTCKRSFNPLQPNHTWVPEIIAQLGIPHAIRAWEREQRSKRTKRNSTKSDMPFGALHKWVRPMADVAFKVSRPQLKHDAARCRQKRRHQGQEISTPHRKRARTAGKLGVALTSEKA